VLDRKCHDSISCFFNFELVNDVISHWKLDGPKINAGANLNQFGNVKRASTEPIKRL
jgi:hypothetical protein